MGIENNRNMRDAIKDMFGDTLTIKDNNDLWAFCELMQSFYVLKKAAELYGRGRTNYGPNACKDILQNTEETKKINGILLPSIFDALESLLHKYR